MSRRTTGSRLAAPEPSRLLGRRRFLHLDRATSPARPALPAMPHRAAADRRRLAAQLEGLDAPCAACGRPVDPRPSGALCPDCRLRRALAVSFAAARSEVAT